MPNNFNINYGKELREINDWNSTHFGSYQLLFHPDTTYLQIDSDILLIGHTYNPWAGESNEQRILEELLARKNDKENFYDYLDELSGRFVLLVNFSNELAVFGDCSVTRLISYAEVDNELFISSHPQLLARVIKAPYDKKIKEMLGKAFYDIGIRHLPGTKTEYENINILTANTYLSKTKNKLKIKRFFPRKPFIPLDISYEEIIEKVACILKESMELLQKRNNLIISLTGGVDSRMTMAAATDIWKDVSFYTFSDTHKEDNDIVTVNMLVEKYKINHHTEKITSHENDVNYKEFLTNHRMNIGQVRNINEANKIYHLNYKYWPEDTLEVKSTVSEIARCFYEKKTGIKRLPNKLSNRNMSNMYKRNFFNRDILKYTDSVFNEFRQKTSFGENFNELRETDMFYWEHRLSAWQSLVLQDSDYSHDSSVIFNNRKIMIYMLSIDKEKLYTDQAHKDIIATLCPGLEEGIVSNTGYKSFSGLLRTNLEKYFFKINNF